MGQVRMLPCLYPYDLCQRMDVTVRVMMAECPPLDLGMARHLEFNTFDDTGPECQAIPEVLRGIQESAPRRVFSPVNAIETNR